MDIEYAAHQRIIRERAIKEEPRSQQTSLKNYNLFFIDKINAKTVIEKYEWLGDIGNATIFVGLYSPSPNIELHGVACFGHGPASNMAEKLNVDKAFCLERGACVHYAPPNAASYLINRACKKVYQEFGVSVFFAYGDPMAGEYGAVYQAAGWNYLGQGLGANGRQRVLRYYVLPDGFPDIPQNWKPTRALKRNGQKRLSIDGWVGSANMEDAKREALEVGFYIGTGDSEAQRAGFKVAWRPGKHVYATHVGRDRDRKEWKRQFGGLAYPSPRPNLKLSKRR